MASTQQLHNESVRITEGNNTIKVGNDQIL